MRPTLALALLIALAALPTCAQTDASAPPRPVELGGVAWERDLDAALRRAAAESKPVLLLFQEIPG